MPCKIYLRNDQNACDRNNFTCSDTTIFAPEWVKRALLILAEHLTGITFEVYDNFKWNQVRSNKPIESFTISDDFNQCSLKTLQKIARNEAHNTSGVINTSLYPDIHDIKVLYSIRDLVRQCVVAGMDETTSCGGYKCKREIQLKQRVYLCDLAALQFQQPYNTGRLVLVQEREPHKGILDDFIYEHVVGESKTTYEDILNCWNSSSEFSQEAKTRYLKHDGYGLPGKGSCFIDTKAYRKFVANDVLLSGMALAEVASQQGDQIRFKFLKYGTGFFAWRFAQELDRLILSGVVDGLEDLFGRGDTKVLNTIKSVELPFFKTDPKNKKRIDALEDRFGIIVMFTDCDALKQSCSKNKLVIATTNCGDNHAVCGNEMGFSSVDAAIAENLTSKGNLFCPNINVQMTERYLAL